MGGSSNEGITSGLSSPRQNYFDAGRVLPTREEFEQAKSMYPQFEVPKGQGLSRFLMTTGLNLLSPGVAEGGTMSGIDWLDGFFRCCGGKDCVDAIAIHIYEIDYKYH